MRWHRASQTKRRIIEGMIKQFRHGVERQKGETGGQQSMFYEWI